MAIRYGIVVAAHPEDHSVDLVMTDDYSRLAGVQVLNSGGGAASGTNDMFVPEEKTGEEKWSISKRTAADHVAAVDFSGVMPVVVGFRYPQIGQMTFKDKNRRVQRHSSDVYSTITSTGDFEMSFPNGTFIRVGASPAHEDLTGLDVDGNWKIAKNTGAATHLRLVLGNAGAVKADLHIDPSGNVIGSFKGTGDLTFDGDVVLHAPKVTIDSPETICTGTLTVQGLLTYLAGLAGSGGAVAASITGPVNITGQTTLAGVTSNGKNVGGDHQHADSGGSGTGGAPI